MSRIVLLFLACLAAAVLVAGCGGGSGESESAPPSLSSIEACLGKKAEVERGKGNADEVVATTPKKVLILAFTFLHGTEGKEAAAQLEETEAEAEGGEREVESLHGGRAVISLSNDPQEADLELARGCVE